MSQRIYSKHSLNIFQLERDEWEFPLHKHNFFEMIFIEKGHGWQILNSMKFPYKVGDVFLLTPEDEHEFVVEERTLFGYLKFTEQLLMEKTGKDTNSTWRQKISHTLLNPNAIPGSVITSEEDRESIFTLLRLLRQEYTRVDMYSRPATLELFGAMMIIVARNLNKKTSSIIKIRSKEEEKVSNILAYVRENILSKEKLKPETMAKQFLMSPNYISIFLKKHTGLSIQKLVTETKIQTAERLLKQSDMTISEIAARLNYTDSSHFNKIFKKYKNVSPKEYR